MTDSYGFRPNGYNQIIVFKDEELFKEIMAANPHMTAIMGADDHTRKEFPGVFIAGLVEYLPKEAEARMEHGWVTVQGADTVVAK